MCRCGLTTGSGALLRVSRHVAGNQTIPYFTFNSSKLTLRHKKLLTCKIFIFKLKLSELKNYSHCLFLFPCETQLILKENKHYPRCVNVKFSHKTGKHRNFLRFPEWENPRGLNTCNNKFPLPAQIPSSLYFIHAFINHTSYTIFD